MDMEDVGTKCRICGNRKGNEIYKCKDRRLNLSGGGYFQIFVLRSLRYAVVSRCT
mgnify:CR=1 FL=1